MSISNCGQVICHTPVTVVSTPRHYTPLPISFNLRFRWITISFTGLPSIINSIHCFEFPVKIRVCEYKWLLQIGKNNFNSLCFWNYLLDNTEIVSFKYLDIHFASAAEVCLESTSMEEGLSNCQNWLQLSEMRFSCFSLSPSLSSLSFFLPLSLSTYCKF